MSKQSFLKHAVVYGLATLLVQAGGFILVPLYTKCLHPADYGVLEVLGRLAETVGTCLLFGGFRQALLTFYQQSTGDLERRRVVGSTLACLVVACLLGGGLIFALARPMSGWLDLLWQRDGPPLQPQLLRLAVLAILLEPLSLIPLTLIQARVESTLFVVISVSQLLVRVGLLLILVYGLGWGVAGVLTATAATAALYGIGLSLREVVRGAAWPQLSQVRAMVCFALPFVPGGLCFFLLHHGDRFFLMHWCGAEEVGIYALGYKLGMVVSMFSLSPLYMVWAPRMYEVARTQEAPAVFGRVFTRILAVYLLGALAVGLFADEIVRLLSGRDYARASVMVAPILLACFFQSAASLMDAGFYVRHRTGRKLGITLLATAVMLGLYVLLIPRLGSMGAALATLFGFLFLAFRTWRVSQGIFPVHYEWGRLGLLLAMTAGLWLLSRGLPLTPWAIAFKLLLLLAAPVLTWTSGLMSPAEKEQMVSHLAHVWQLVLRSFGFRPADREPDSTRPQSTGMQPAAPLDYLDDAGQDVPCIEEQVSF
jgi:O-antigen/teichoic acid export membrane protein